jgi:hypothetical protein
MRVVWSNPIQFSASRSGTKGATDLCLLRRLSITEKLKRIPHLVCIKMECPVCYAASPTYVINCGSTTPHTICDTCEVQIRMKEPATRNGRVLKCPICRGVEKVSGRRTAFSYEFELQALYNTTNSRIICPDLRCCESGICMGMTTRTCTYPDGCSRYVCTNCMMCVSHFSGPSH